MKFGQLIEYNRNIYVEKSYIKFGGETIPRPLSKKSKLSMSISGHGTIIKTGITCKEIPL